MRSIWKVGILLALSLAGCGGDTDGSKASDEERMQTIGLYKATGEKLRSASIEYFVITADQSCYTLQKNQNRYDRAYKGQINQIQYKFSNNTFESGDINGTKLAGTESDIPAEIQLVASLNEIAKKILIELNKENLALEFRLEQTSPSFKDTQKTLLEGILAQVSVLVAHMKDRKLKAFWINDYTNTTLYTKNENLHLPAGYTESAAKLIEQLKTNDGITAY